MKKLLILIALLFSFVGFGFAQAITFNENKNITKAYFYDVSANTYTYLGTYNSAINYFPDDAAVGDCLVINVGGFGGGAHFTKYQGLNFDVATQLAATSITTVWEYARRTGGTTTVPTWTALAGVTDNTNSFQTAGANSVTWTMPEDWENYINPGATVDYYSWCVRCRITAIDTPTEGGKQAATALTVKDYTIHVSGYAEATPARLQNIYDADVAGGWGRVTKTVNSYTFDCGLVIESGCYFTTQQEVIQFKKNWDMKILGVIKSGLVVSGDKCKYGSEFIFNLYNATLYNSSLVYTNAEIYNTHYRYIYMTGSVAHMGHWGGFLGSMSGQKIYDIYGEGLRQFSFNETTNVIIGAKGFGFHVESPGAILKNITCYGSPYSVRPNITSKGANAQYMHECDFSGATSSPINPYLYTTNHDDFLFHLVDCNWGIFADTNLVYWQAPGINDKVYQINSFLLKVIDKDNNAISGVIVDLENKDGTEVFNYTTNADGYPGQDSGTVSSATASTLTDGSKAWAANQWWYKEVYITSGTGVGQRRIIKKGNTGTSLPIAPDWDITPNGTSKYIIIPYVNVKLIEPLTPDISTACWSTTTTYNPFTLKISHQDYPSREFKFTLDKKIDWKIALSDRPMDVGMMSVYGTEYSAGEASTIYAQLFYGDGVTSADGATVTLTLYKADGTKELDGVSMSYVAGSKGVYKYDFNAPTEPGNYIADVRGANPTAYGSAEVHVSQALVGTTFGAVVADAGNSTTTFKTDLTQATNDFYNNMTLVFVTGNNTKQVRRITDYNGTTKFITVDPALSNTPAAGYKFQILPEWTTGLTADDVWSYATRQLTTANIAGGGQLATTVETAAIKADTAAILEDTGTTLPAQISGVETKIDTMQSDVTAIKAETDKIPSIKTETDKISGIETYTKRLQAEILNRETLVKSGSTIKIRYRSVSGLTGAGRPELDVFKPDGTQVVTDAKMNEIGSSKVYSYDLTLDSGWGTGEFTVICADTTTGQLDSLSLTVLTTDLADIRAGITDLETHFTTIEGKIDTIDTNIDTLITEIGTGRITAIKTETDKIASIKTTVEDTNTKVDSINLDTDAVIAKWGTYKASDIIGYVDNVESRLGAPTDASTADTVFGDIKTLQEKWGSYTASDIYGVKAGATVVPYTVGNEVLTAAIDAYKQLDALRDEVRALGKTTPAYEALLSLQASLNGISAALGKLETSSIHPLYAQVLEIASQLKATGIIKGDQKVMSLYEILAEHAGDVQYLKKKLEELKAVSELSKEIIKAQKEERKKAIIKTSW